MADITMGTTPDSSRLDDKRRRANRRLATALGLMALCLYLFMFMVLVKPQ